MSRRGIKPVDRTLKLKRVTERCGYPLLTLQVRKRAVRNLKRKRGTIDASASPIARGTMTHTIAQPFPSKQRMTNHKNQHSAGHHHEHHAKKRGLHKDWRAWVVVGLMLAAIVAYILSLDESDPPGGQNEEPRVPAAP